MSEYLLNEFSFQMPEGLHDKTHHIFALSDDGPSAFNIVVSRSPIGEDETLASYGTKLQQELARALAAFRVLSDKESLVDGEPALELRFQWLAEGKLMHQTQVSFFHQQESGPRMILQIAATTTGGEQGKWAPEFDKMLQSIVLRRPKRTEARTPAPSFFPSTY